VIVPFDQLSQIYRIVDPPDIVLVSESFADENRFVIDVRRSRGRDWESALTEKRLRFERIYSS
jgi:hypothetical protein